MKRVCRQKRTDGRNGRPFRLTDRDRWVLEAVGKMRFVPTAILAQLFFGGSRWTANKRLRKLFDAGLIRVWVRSLSDENLYSLTRNGAKLLAEDHGSEDTPPVPRGLDGNLAHLLIINTVRVSLALTLPNTDGELTWWRSDWEFSRTGSQGQAVPDAVFGIRWHADEEQLFALEVDHRSRSPRAFLRKVTAYDKLRARQGSLLADSDFIVLVVGTDPHLIERYRQSLDHMHLGTPIFFTSLDRIKTEGATGSVWKTSDGEDEYSLREVSTFPYGKEEKLQETLEVLSD